MTTGCSQANSICISCFDKTGESSSLRELDARKWHRSVLLKTTVHRAKVDFSSQALTGKKAMHCRTKSRDLLSMSPHIWRASAKRAYEEFVRKTRSKESANDVMVRGSIAAVKLCSIQVSLNRLFHLRQRTNSSVSLLTRPHNEQCIRGHDQEVDISTLEALAGNWTIHFVCVARFIVCTLVQFYCMYIQMRFILAPTIPVLET
jgi:hypothetical protein